MMDEYRHKDLTEKIIGCFYKVYLADFVVEEKVVVEIKASVGLGISDESQLLNYLRCTGLEVGLLLNFGKKAEVKRKVFREINNGSQIAQMNADLSKSVK